MSHLFESGVFYRQPAWHGLGLVVDERPSYQRARELIGLDWEPIEAPSYAFRGITADGTVVHKPGPDVVGDFFEEVDNKRVLHSGTGKTLAIPSDTYTLIDHTAQGEILAAALEDPNFKLETLVELDGGRQVVALAYLDEPITLPGDDSAIYPFVALDNRHDGNGGCSLRTTSIRIVCRNTANLSELEGQRTGAVFTFRHTKNWRNRIEEARQAIRGVRQQTAEYVELATDLLGVTVTPRQAELFIREFIPSPPDGIVSDRVARNIEEARAAVRGILASPTTVAVSHTAYGLVQAAVEYLDHARAARSPETRLGRSLLRPEPLKGKAVKLAREVALVAV